MANPKAQALANGYWQIMEDPNGDGTSDVRSFNEQGVATSPVITGIQEVSFYLGPTFGSELFAAGVNDGVSWNSGSFSGGVLVTPAVISFDPQRIGAGLRQTLYNVVANHDPTAQPPAVDPWREPADQLQIDAQSLVENPLYSSDPTLVQFFTDYLVMYAMLP